MDHIGALRDALGKGPVRISVKPGKRESRIVKSDPFTIEIAARPIAGAANNELLSYLKTNVGACTITSGQRSRIKRVELQ